MKKQVSLLLILIVITALLVAVVGDEAFASRDRFGPRTLTPSQAWFGNTYGGWAADWFQWALRIPADENHPVLAEGDVDCSLGQLGDVWFLAGATGNWPAGEISVERTCIEPIPTGKALFFPVVNIICSTYEDGEDEEDLGGCADFVSTIQHPLSASIDGKRVGGLQRFATKSPFFYISPLPEDNLYGWVTDMDGMGITTGYYLMLPPLSEGEHDISYSGWILAPDYGVDWKLHVVYHLTVGMDE